MNEANTTVIHLDESCYYDLLIDREVENVYTSEGREVNRYGCHLEPAICIVVEGSENGQY